VLNLGVVGTVIAVRAAAPALMLASVGFVLAAVLMHGLALRAAARRALPSPSAFTVHVYIAACALLVPGVLLGATLELIGDEHALMPQLMLSHVALNLLGWVGLPILGTIVTLWPTMLRTHIAPNAARLGRSALPLLVAGVVVTALGFGFDVTQLAALGLAAYLVGFVRTLHPMFVVMRNKRPAAFSTWSALTGLMWLLVTVLVLGVQAVLAHDHQAVESGLALVAFLGIVGVLQVVTGCMAYLIPSMAAGGPSTVRWRNDRADRRMVLRWVLVNSGALLCLAPMTRYLGATLLLAGFGSSLALIAGSARTPSPSTVAEAEAARVWLEDKEVRPYPFRNQ
jgi:nitrite reductase (NO-forming)